ncbi:MAG TPA: methyl-accepting chemotaxis protein [Tardiphaga sp.]
MRLTVKAKLAGAFGIVILLSAISGGVAYVRLTEMIATAETIVSAADRMGKTAEIEKGILLQIRAEKNVILAATEAQADQYAAEAVELRSSVTKTKDEAYAGATEAGKRLIERFVPAYVALNAAQDQTIKLAKTDKTKAMESSTTEVRKAAAAALTAAKDYEVFVKKFMADRAEQAKEDGARAQWLLLALVSASFVIALGSATWIALNISRGLGRAVDLADAVALGDLSKKIGVSSDDEIGDLVKSLNAMTVNLNATAKTTDSIADGDLSIEIKPLSDLDTLGLAMKRMAANLKATANVADAIANGDLTVDAKRLTDKDTLGIALERMLEKLRIIVSDTVTAAQNVSAGSQELSASAEQLSQGASEQASAAEEASASMEEMAANVKQNAENAGQTEKIARQSAKDAEASGAAVGRAVEAMQTIAGKITIVQEIARQTDLLALNAAVEAARAGEHGKGFAVVASEVRKLAERSQTAAAEIGTLSAETVKAAQEAGAMLSRLVPDIKKTAELVEEISAACREQDVGSSQINQAIQQLDKVGQQNAGASEQVSSTSEELASQAEQLQSTIAYFKIEQAARERGRPAVIDKAVAELRARAASMSELERGGKRPVPAKSTRGLKVAGGGFALEMNDRVDERDAEFQR